MAVLGGVLLVLLATAMGGPAGASTLPRDLRVLRTQLLSTADLPSGWSTTTPGTSASQAISACRGRPFGPAHRIAQSEAAFQDPSGVSQLTETIGLYRSPGQVFRRSVRSMRACHAVALAERRDTMVIHLARLHYRGRHTTAFALSFRVKGQAVGIDLVIERIGNEIAQLSVADVPAPSMRQVRSLVQRAVAKIDKTERARAR